MINEQEAFDLERLIDRRGIGDVLNMIARISSLKASHISETWQDASLALRWDRLATAIVRIVPKAEGL